MNIASCSRTDVCVSPLGDHDTSKLFVYTCIPMKVAFLALRSFAWKVAEM